ncbi:hypothetical protein [uncultured Methanobrevibacter sp.]
MDGMDPEDYIIYSTFFEDEQETLDKNEACCSSLIVLMVLMVLITVIV